MLADLIAFFYALRTIEPLLVQILFAGVGPVCVVWIDRLVPELGRRRHTTRPRALSISGCSWPSASRCSSPWVAGPARAHTRLASRRWAPASRSSPLTVRVVLAGAPVLVFLLQLIEGRLSSSPYSLGVAVLYGVFALGAALARRRAILRRDAAPGARTERR